jgi:hypothetical protein
MKLSDFPRKCKVEDSSNIAAIYYDQDSMTMAVKFKSSTSGREWYAYDKVPANMFGSLISSPSVGKAFQQLFRQNDGIPFTRHKR